MSGRSRDPAAAKVASARTADAVIPPRSGPTYALGAFVLVVLAVLGLREIASLIVPILFGLFLALLASPLVDRFERRGTSHRVALAAAIGVVLVVVLAAVAVIALSVSQLVALIPRYEDRLGAVVGDISRLFAGFGIEVDPETIPGLLTPGALASFVQSTAGAIGRTAGALFILAFTMIYALAGAPSLLARAQGGLGEDHAVLAGISRFGVDLRRFLIVRAQLGLFAAVLVFVLLLVLGVPLPALWAMLVFAASFIPNVGTILALVPPTILALLDSGAAAAAAVVVGFTLINFAQDYLLQPRMMGLELNLSPLVIFVSIIVWAWVLGPAGALLAVPLTVAVVAFLEAYPASRPIALLLRDHAEAEPGLSDAAGDAG
ncbi:MAG TPA: AI-2E family transporter [Candidatus Limnocylindrales bacterium]|jgi:predicted PurR-regulated permease PerM|nr:AI-2E family transporter [Candidatus Limnocylindrales bacterium]